MTRGVSWFLVAPLVLLGLSGCKFGLFDRREPWRSDAEERCLAGGEVKPSAYIVPMREIDGAGTCGMDHPFRVMALNQGTVEVAPKATLACPMTSAVDRWMAEDIQPAAMAWFGQPVAKVKQMSSYSCRNMNGGPRGKISEHAFGNALDIGGFELADGRIILVKTGWKGRPDEQGFLRTVQATGCQRFTTTLGPGYNIYHYDHIHVDLMRRAGRTSCNPNVTPPRPPNLPVFKAPPMVRPLGPMVDSGEAEAGTQEDFGPGGGAPVSAAPAYPAPAYPAPVARAPAAPAATPARVPAAAPAPLSAPGEPMPLTPQGYGSGQGYGAGHGVDPNYRPAAPAPAARPAAAYPAPTYPAAPPQGYPAGGYPTNGYPASGYPAPAAPAQAYPAQGYPAQGYPAQGYPAQGYPAQGYPAPAPAPAAAPPATTRSRPPGVPLPPAGIPLAKWLGLDTTPTGSTGTASSSNVRSFTNERRFASPIPGPEGAAD